MSPERRTLAIWLTFGSIVGIAFFARFYLARPGDCESFGGPAASGGSPSVFAGGGANTYCDLPPRHFTVLHGFEGGAIGLAVATMTIGIWYVFTLCIPSPPPVIRPAKRGLLRSGARPRH